MQESEDIDRRSNNVSFSCGERRLVLMRAFETAPGRTAAPSVRQHFYMICGMMFRRYLTATL